MATKGCRYSVLLRMGLPLCLAVALLLGLLNVSAQAMTLEYLKKYVGELEVEQQATQKELDKLKSEIGKVTRDGASLKERKEYTDRVIELMKKLEELQKRQAELLREARNMPHVPPVLKLVAIDVPEVFSNCEKVGAGLRVRHSSEINVRNGGGDTGLVDTVASLRILYAPLEIRPGQPFEVRAEAMMRKSYPAEHWCTWSQGRETAGLVGVAISSKDINAFLQGQKGLESYCHESQVKKHEWPLSMDRVWYTKGATIKGDSVNLTVRFTPIKNTISGNTQVYYYDASASGAGALKLDVKTQYPFFAFDLPTDNRGYLLPSVDTRDSFGSRGSHGITINVTMPLMGGLALRYEPVRETDPVLTSLSIPDHPSEFFKPLAEGEIGSTHAVPNVIAKKVDTAKKLIEDVGLVADARVKEAARSEDQQLTVISQDPAPRTALKRGGQVKLVIYGPYTPQTGVVLPSFVGRRLGESKEWLERSGLMASLRPGSPAPTAAKSKTIEKQLPPPGTKARPGDTVTLIVHSEYVELRQVPNVMGLSAGKAKRNIAESGLNTVLQPGSAPFSREQAGTVERQTPDPGTSAPAGSQVTLYVRTPFVETGVVPDVRGLSYLDSRRKIEAAGLIIDRREGGRPTEKRLAETAQKQEPTAGTKVAEGSTVLVWIYGLYEPTKDEQVAATDCSRYPGSKPYWDNSHGKPWCGCFDGLQWNMAGTQCITADARAQELCSRNHPGSVPTGRDANGRVICDCPQGYVWKDAAKTACERQLPPHELCSRNHPGSVPTGRDADGRVVCDCPQGYTWTTDNRSCVRRSVVVPPQEKCSHLITQISHFMAMYRRDPRNNSHLKYTAELNAQEARLLGCNQGHINQALGTGGGEEDGGCHCIDERGRRYRGILGQPCETVSSALRDYNCAGSGSRGGITSGGGGIQSGTGGGGTGTGSGIQRPGCSIVINPNRYNYRYFYVTTKGRDSYGDIKYSVTNTGVPFSPQHWGPGTQQIGGTYGSEAEALSKAKGLCPNGKIYR